MKNFAEILFVNEVRDLQNDAGTGELYSKIYKRRVNQSLTDQEISFIAQRESFYIASVSSTGWPYIQHRGGPRGFLKILGDNLIGFADYSGNKQFVTMGHAIRNDKVSLFLMDYENRARLKVLGRLNMCHVEDADSELREQLDTKGQGHVDRIATITVESLDWNCPKYIPQFMNAEKFIPDFKKVIEENESLKKQIEILRSQK